MKKIFLIVSLLSTFFIYDADAACTGSSPTWNATADYTSVNSCVSQAQIGDTVNVAAGSQTWSSTLVLTKPISLIGAGIGSTVITGSSGLIIKVYPSNWSETTHLYRVSGFSFNLNTNSVGMLIGANTMSSVKYYTQDTPSLPKIRVDHNRFYNSHNTSIKAIENRCFFEGVVDHNTFDDVYYPIRNDSQGTAAAIASMWQYTYSHWSLGNSYTIYYEDNIFTGVYYDSGSSVVMDGQYGARYVARYNTFSALTEWQPAFDEHGEFGGDMVAGFGIELYGNKGLTQGGRFAALRGGKQLSFFNQAPSGGAYVSVQQDACPSSNSALSGYSQYWPYMITHDTYIFNNRAGTTGSLFDYGISRSTSNCMGYSTLPAAGVQFFTNSTSPGVTAGTLANRPATCTTGQGYWATNQSTTDLTGMVGANPTTPISGTFYKCTATNTWTSFYTPYTYPHPLTTITGGPPPPPPPPPLQKVPNPPQIMQVN